MMDSDHNSLQNAQRMWNRYLDASREKETVRYKLLSEPREHVVAVVARALRKPSERSAAIELVALLGIEDRKKLLPEILSVASYVCPEVFRARELLATLPRNWLLENIEAAAEPLLSSDDDEDYRRVLEVYVNLDKNLTLKLANRASRHADPEVRGVGAEVLEALDRIDEPD